MEAQISKARGVSINRLMDLATPALTQYDTETRFRALAQRGSRKRGGLNRQKQADGWLGSVDSPRAIMTVGRVEEDRG